MSPDAEHPDPTGPEKPDEPTPARDGNVTPLRAEGNGGNGKPLAEREEESPENEDGQFTLELAGRTVKLGGLVKANTPINYHYKVTGRSIPDVSKQAVIDPYESSFLMVADCVVDSIKPAYIRDGEGKVTEVNLYVELKPRFVLNALSEAGETVVAEAKKKAAAAA